MIPPQAKSVFKGEIFEIFQWDQEMYDGSMAVFEAARRPDTVEVLTTLNGNVVVLEQTQPHMPDAFRCLPGGRLDPGEDPITAAKRELREETGLESDDWELFEGQVKVSGKVHWTNHVYLARDCREVGPQDLDGGERILVTTVTFEEFMKLPNDPRFLHTGLVLDLLRAAYDPDRRERLQKRLFPEG